METPATWPGPDTGRPASPTIDALLAHRELAGLSPSPRAQAESRLTVKRLVETVDACRRSDDRPHVLLRASTSKTPTMGQSWPFRPGHVHPVWIGATIGYPAKVRDSTLRDHVFAAFARSCPAETSHSVVIGKAASSVEPEL